MDWFPSVTLTFLTLLEKVVLVLDILDSATETPRNHLNRIKGLIYGLFFKKIIPRSEAERDKYHIIP